jgi:hypothetical protein
MIKNKTMLIMAILLSVVGNTNAACLFGNPPAIEKEFAKSQSVFIGKVMSVDGTGTSFNTSIE